MRKAKRRKEIQFLNSVLLEVKDYELITPDTMIQTFNLTKISAPKQNPFWLIKLSL